MSGAHELDRIERAIVEARIPSSWKDRKELFHTLIFDLKFPGYGMGGLGEESLTDNGAKLLVESIEIPQRDKERYIVVLESGGILKLVDDFVSSTASNSIHHATLEKGKIYYRDKTGLLVREKQL